VGRVRGVARFHLCRRLVLSKGYSTLLDTGDYSRAVVAGCWFASERSTGHVYAARDFVVDGKNNRVYLHRWILGAPAGKQVDHIDGDGLNNRRSNLRVVSASENMLNQTKPTRAVLGYRGVARIEDSGNFRAYCNVNGEQIQLGVFQSPELAASARDHYAIANLPTAPLNFPEGVPHSAEEIDASRIVRPRAEYANIRLKGGVHEVWARRGGRKVYVGRFVDVADALRAQHEFPV